MVAGREQLISGMHMVGTKKSLGQHWLKNREILNRIADLASDDDAESDCNEERPRLCLEIGPGLGFLTSSLLRRFDKVIAVEFDERLAENLSKSFPGKNLKIIKGDVLQYDFGRISESYVVAGNIPYYITSPIIEKVLTTSRLPRRVVLLIQKEVADRILDKKETLLSLFVKNRATVSAGIVVPASEFTPPPKVDSKVIIMTPHVPIVSEKVFELIQRGFRAPRKKVIHNLMGLRSKEELAKVLVGLGVSADARPGDLSLEIWQKLYDMLF